VVELFIRGPLSIYSLEVIQGVLEEGAAAGVDIVISSHPRGPRAAGAGRAAPWVKELIARKHRAAIGLTTDLRQPDLAALARARLPLVVIDPLNAVQVDVTSVGSTNFAGGLAATQHLLSLGHRRVAYLGGPRGASCNQARLHGYRAAMEAAGAPVPPGYVQSRAFHYVEGLAGGGALLDLPEPPTAVFAGSDELALGVIEAARARGRRVPEDLSIVGFDDTTVARLASPPLTTIRQPLREMGAVALRTVLRLAAGEEVDSHHVELATQLVVRGSARAPAGLTAVAAS
jgi:LacI family transcriptional regulator